MVQIFNSFRQFVGHLSKSSRTEVLPKKIPDARVRTSNDGCRVVAKPERHVAALAGHAIRLQVLHSLLLQDGLAGLNSAGV